MVSRRRAENVSGNAKLVHRLKNRLLFASSQHYKNSLGNTIGKNVRIGDGVKIFNGCKIKDGCVLLDAVIMEGGSVLEESARIEENTVLIAVYLIQEGEGRRLGVGYPNFERSVLGYARKPAFATEGSICSISRDLQDSHAFSLLLFHTLFFFRRGRNERSGR